MTALVTKVKAKLDQVNDYEADGNMKTDVSFIKAPIGKVKVYFKKPNKFRLKKRGHFPITQGWCLCKHEHHHHHQ